MIRKGIIITKDGARFLGGPGSGNFGHAGIPGQRGGSAPGGGGGGGSKAPQPTPTKTIGQDVYGFMGLDETDIDSDLFLQRGYDEDEAGVISAYKAHHYKAMNKAAIMSGCPDSDNSSPCADVKVMDKAISKSKIIGDATLYHGMGEREAAMFEGLDVGSEFKNKAFYSTSLDEDAANVFADSGHKLVIDIPHGYNALVYGDSKYESEVVLPRNQNFTVYKVDVNGKNKTYYVKPVKK